MKTTFLILAFVFVCSCRQGMYDQPRYEPYEQTDFFANEMASRPVPEHTVPRGMLHEDGHFYRGVTQDRTATEFPYPVSEAMLERGQEQYQVFCSPCHGALGDGDGIIVRHGFSPPPSYHIDRLRKAPPGHFFDVITNGYGAMYSYRDRVRPHDRWAIAAYIQALQLSQRAKLAELPDEIRTAFSKEVTGG